MLRRMSSCAKLCIRLQVVVMALGMSWACSDSATSPRRDPDVETNEGGRGRRRTVRRLGRRLLRRATRPNTVRRGSRTDPRRQLNDPRCRRKEPASGSLHPPGQRNRATAKERGIATREWTRREWDAVGMVVPRCGLTKAGGQSIIAIASQNNMVGGWWVPGEQVGSFCPDGADQ